LILQWASLAVGTADKKFFSPAIKSKNNFAFNKSPQFSSLKKGVWGKKAFFQESFFPRENSN
jgi:hypothetical protein